MSRRLILLVSHSIAVVLLSGLSSGAALVSIAKGSEKESTASSSDAHGAQLEETDAAPPTENHGATKDNAKSPNASVETEHQQESEQLPHAGSKAPDSNSSAAVGEETQEALVPAPAPAEAESSMKGIVWFAVVFVLLITIIYLFL